MKLPDYADVSFKIVQNGNTILSVKASEMGLIPTEGLYLEPFTEKYSTTTVPEYHGILNLPRVGKRKWNTVSGSWDFYVEDDGEVHTIWDDYGDELHDSLAIRQRCGIPEPTDLSRTLYPGSGNHVTHWMVTYYRVMRFLQGQRLRVAMLLGGSTVTDLETPEWSGRCWVSAAKPDSDGRMVLTISYELDPPEGYGEGT